MNYLVNLGTSYGQVSAIEQLGLIRENHLAL